MPSFYFEQLLQTGLNGIDQQGITAAVLQIAGVILILSLLWAVYEAYSGGGDVRLLGVAAVKYLALGLVFLNYQTAFRAVNGMFNGVADGIYNLSGGVDVLQSWGNSLSHAWSANPNWASTLWGLVTGGISVAIGAVIAVVGYLLLPLTYTLFTLFYALYGSILYVVGPFVLALMPSRSLGQLGRSFFVNMMIFQCWGLLYAILQSLMSALQITDPMQFSGSFLQAFVGSSQVIVMSVASVLLSILIALIPFIATRIVRGDVGSTLMTVISGAVTAGAVASGLAFAGGEGLAAGRTLAPEGPPPPPTGTPGIIRQNTGSVIQGPIVTQAQNGGNGGSAIGESRPPAPLNSEMAMAEQVQLSPQEVRILLQTETPLPLQLMLWILQLRHERDRRPLCAMPRPARCFPGAAAVGKNPATWPHPQVVLGRRERRLRLEELDRRQCRPRSSRLRRSRPYWSRGLAGRASGWPDDATYWKGKEQ
jgi:hypothetical protein